MRHSSRNIVLFLVTLYLTVGYVNATAEQRFSNFSPALTVLDIEVTQDSVWVATSGGLSYLSSSDISGRYHASGLDFPDLRLSSLDRDFGGNLWVGSDLGYLTVLRGDGSKSIYSSYQIAGWDIRDLFVWNDFVFVASSQGLSIFEIAKERAYRNATKFATFKGSKVNAVRVHKDVLFLGCDDGTATLDISNGRIRTYNFYDQGIWDVRETEKPITGFVEYNGALLGVSRPSAYFDGKLVHADSNVVLLDGRPALVLPSEITAIVSQEHQCWIGTKDNYYYRWRLPADTLSYKLPGIPFGMASRIESDQKGGVWILSNLTPVPTPRPWYQGVVYYDGGSRWDFYNKTDQSFGYFGDGPWLDGLAVDRTGTVWIGASGGNVKRRHPSDTAWSVYYVSGRDAYGGFRLFDRQELPGGWGKSDAIAQDSSGYMWISSWENHAGCLIAYDPKQKDPSEDDYKRHIPLGDPYFMLNIRSLCVDAANVVFAGSELGKLLAFRYNGSPLQGNIQRVIWNPSLTTIYDMAATTDTTVWIITGEGLYRAKSQWGTLTRDTIVNEAVTSVETESNRILWLGTESDGLIRYDTWEGTKKKIRQEDGLVANAINDLSIDRTNGYLWIATSDGVSRYDLGHSGTPIAKNSGSLEVYPNPFSLSHPDHRTVTFARAAPKTTIEIRSVRGQLVKRLVPTDQNEFSSQFEWKPENLLPGTYFYLARNDFETVAGKMVIVP